jgi:hypothetical protein
LFCEFYFYSVFFATRKPKFITIFLQEQSIKQVMWIFTLMPRLVYKLVYFLAMYIWRWQPVYFKRSVCRFKTDAILKLLMFIQIPPLRLTEFHRKIIDTLTFILCGQLFLLKGLDSRSNLYISMVWSTFGFALWQDFSRPTFYRFRCSYGSKCKFAHSDRELATMAK